MGYVELGIRGMVFAVFAVSLATKLAGRTAFSEFVAAADAMTGVDRRLAILGGAVAVVSESGILLALAIGDGASVGFGAAIGVLVAFSLVLGAALARGRQVRCRCFGADGSMIGARHLVRNALLVAICSVGLLSKAAAPRQTAGAALALTAGVIAGLILTRWDDLSYLAVGDLRPSRRSRA